MNKDLKKAIEEARRKEMNLDDDKKATLGLTEMEISIIGFCLNLVIESFVQSINDLDSFEEQLTLLTMIGNIQEIDDKLFELAGK